MAFVLLALPLLAACSVLVDPDALEVRCEVEDGDHDPCLDLGQVCVVNVCRDCDSEQRELCNGRDDDCDGKIDEGHDADKDGFTWCGGGKVEMADCVDSDSKIHPPESNGDAMPTKEADVCDGKDNDCDDKVDEDGGCPSMKEKCKDDMGCPKDQRCDVETGVCFVPRDVGSGCTNDSDCKGGFCLRPGMFGLTGLTEVLKDNRCSKACCSNADCDEDSSCLISSMGARVCLPKTIVVGGPRKVGEGCVRDLNCATGLCSRGVCQARCLNAGGCTNQECMLTQISTAEPRIFVCGPPARGAQPGEACGLAGCRTGFCDDDFDCIQPCGRDADCGTNKLCDFFTVDQPFGPPSSVSVCRPRPNGDPEGIEHLCCTDADCGMNQLCAPNAVERSTTQWHMSCRGK